MRVYDIVETLTEMLDAATGDKTLARAQYGTVEYLLGWLEEQAIAEKADSSYLHQKFSEIRRGFRHSCGLLSEEELTRDPCGEARQALAVLTGGALLGSVEGLRFRVLSDIK